MSSIAFDNIAATIRKPGIYQEENNRRALSGVAGRPSRALIVGLQTSTATQSEATLLAVPDADTAETYFGRGSMVAQMVRAFKRQNPHTELYACALDPASGTNATVDTVFSGTATAAGTVALSVAGRRIEIPVAVGDTATNVGDAIDTEIALAKNTDLGVTSSNTTGTVTWTADDDGTHGNQIRIIVSPRETDSIPAGLTLTGGDEDQYLASGATDADVDTALTAVGNEDFQIVACGFTDTTNLGKVQDWLATQWGPTVKKEGHSVAGYTGTLANTTSAGNAENSKHMTLIGPGKIPQTPWIVAAVGAARVARNWEVDPNRPMQNTFLVEGQEDIYGIDAPKAADKFTDAQIETLLSDGVACIEYVVGKPKIVRMITTYQTNASAVPDTSYMDTITMLNLMNYFYQWRVMLSTKYPNSKAAANNTSFAPGVAIVQPVTLEGDAADLYEDMIDQGWVQDLDGFVEDLNIVYPGGSSDSGRFDIQTAPRLVVGARVFALQHQFILGVPS
jgi:phage tail sheath gpL-like